MDFNQFIIWTNRFYTLIPAGILAGLGAAPMWASKATYLTQVGQVYAKLTDQAVDAIIVRFFGFFFLAWQTAELWGNLISSLGELLFTGINGTTIFLSILISDQFSITQCCRAVFMELALAVLEMAL